MDIIKRIENSKSLWILFSLCLIFFLLRFPSLFEPNWYGDEGIYQSIGFGLRSGRQFYTGVWDNKPPLLFVIYALANGEQFNARLFSLIAGIAAVLVYYHLSLKLFKNYKATLLSILVFVFFFGTPIIEGNIANSENFMLLPILISAYLLYPILGIHNGSLSKLQKIHLTLSGVILSSSFLIKIVSIFDFSAFLVAIFFLLKFPENLNIKSILSLFSTYLQKILWFVLGFITPFILSIIYFFTQGILTNYFDAVLGRNVDYVGWANYFIIPQGLLYLRIIILGVFLSVLFYKRLLLSKNLLFILIWLAFSLFNAFFSYRSYTHYQLVLLPSFALLIGYLVDSKLLKMKILVLTLIISTLLIVYPRFERWTLGRTAAYYNNYFDMISGRINLTAYRAFFDPRNPQDYEISLFIKKHTRPKDVIFLWGNSAQIYPLSRTLPPGRFSAAYHIGTNKNNVLETEKALRITKPEYIIITPDLKYFPFDLSGYSYILSIGDTHIYERKS